MQTPFPFDFFLAFGFLSIMLLTGILLRARISFFQKILFPGCLIGGFLGLILVNTSLVSLDLSRIENIAYHFFNISFISIGLTGNKEEQANIPHREYVRGSAWMGLIQGMTFPLQAVLGGLLVICFSFLGIKLFPTFGFLVPLGFNEGPGQALSIGKVWEGFGFAHGGTIGLTFATIGFLFSFFIGVPLVNWGLRKGYATYTDRKLPRDFLTGIFDKENRPSAGKLTLHDAATDTLAFHAALIGGVYILTYAFLKGVGTFFNPESAKMLWGFFFFFGLGFAFIVRGIFNRIGIGRLIDPGIQTRITGWSVDFLIVAMVVAIRLLVVWTHILPIAVIALTCGLMTTLVVLYFGRRTETYSFERTVAIYGTVTGTVSCGLLLLRIADPDFRTPVAKEMALMNVFAAPIIGGCTALVNGPLWWNWSTGFTVLVFAGIIIVVFILMKVLKLISARRF